MSQVIELEIKALLDNLKNPELVAEKIISDLRNREYQPQPQEIRSVCRFLLKAGLYSIMINYILVAIENGTFLIPWPLFLEALARSRPEISPTLAKTLLEGITEEKALGDACLSKALDFRSKVLKTEREARRQKLIQAVNGAKLNLLDQLKTLRTQQLFEKERELLLRLQSMYPGDPDVHLEVVEHQRRQAVEILSKHRPFSAGPPLVFDDIEDSLKVPTSSFAASTKQIVQEQPEMAKDLAVAAATMDLWELALELLNADPSTQHSWLRLEILFGARHYLEVLSEIIELEVKFAHDSETFFATAYFRAQALWGLGQKHQAVEILESLLASNPNYRSAASLLNLWRGP